MVAFAVGSSKYGPDTLIYVNQLRRFEWLHCRQSPFTTLHIYGAVPKRGVWPNYGWADGKPCFPQPMVVIYALIYHWRREPRMGKQNDKRAESKVGGICKKSRLNKSIRYGVSRSDDGKATILRTYNKQRRGISI